MFGKVLIKGLLAAVILISMTVIVLAADVFNMPGGLTSLEMVTVSNPGNANDSTGSGGVPGANAN